MVVKYAKDTSSAGPQLDVTETKHDWLSFTFMQPAIYVAYLVYRCLLLNDQHE